MTGPRHFNLLVDFSPTQQHQRQIILGVSQFCRQYPRFRYRTSASVTLFLKDAHSVDGVIALLENDDAAARYGRPVVNVSSSHLPLPVPTVATDGRLIGKLAAEHLLRQGYQSFGCCMDTRFAFSCERLAGFSETVRAAGRPVDAFDTKSLTEADRVGHVRLAEWLRNQVKPFGLFSHNDLQAVALIDACREMRLNVPNDVGIVGVDNDELLAELARPGLTSVDPGTPLIGYRAAEVLARMIQGESVPNGVIYLPPRDVVVRESSQSLSLIDERLKAALQFIRQNAARSIGVSDVIDHVPMSRRSFERLFSTALGISPAEEIRRVRINRAKRLIVEGELRLSAVAGACGYGAFRNFATAFRREVGVSPDEYRRTFRPGMPIKRPVPKAGRPLPATPPES
ncbi:MAG TPA: substrate-binding domain-containing protein [Tepidisphaeraceae bacterium]|jgi:LacI family transcriptional regulator